MSRYLYLFLFKLKQKVIMKIVDITNIEDLILTKSEIDNYYIENGINKEKMELYDYMVNIDTLNMIY